MKRFPQKLLQKILAHDGVGILPTDTLYGIVGSAFSKKAVSRIYKVRKRNTRKPLIILMHSSKDMELFGITLSKEDAKILRALGPGKVSVIIPCKNKKFTYLHRGTDALAFRVPAFPALRRLLEQTGPLVAPSANWEGNPPAKTIAEAQEYFGDSVDFYINRGRLASKPSTLVALVNGRLRVVRDGAVRIGKNMIL